MVDIDLLRSLLNEIQPIYVEGNNPYFYCESCGGTGVGDDYTCINHLPHCLFCECLRVIHNLEGEKKQMEGLTPGRIVHFVLPDNSHRPAVVVRVWNSTDGMVNLQVFTDSLNDGEQYRSGLYWATSVHYSEGKESGTWHWIEKA